MRINLKFIFILVLTFIAAIAGCNGAKRKISPKKYTATELINLLNANSAKINKIRCKGGSISIKLPPEERNRRIDMGGLVLLFQRQRDFYMSANILGQPKLYIGSNDEKYWIGVLENRSTLRWGYWKNADRKCNSARTGPQKLLEAFGIVNFKDVKYLGPFLQIRDNANVLMYGQLSANRGEWYFAKEIHISRYEPIVITKIVYFTESNETELVIDLSDYRKLASGGYFPGRISLYWPSHDSFMKIRLGKITMPESLPLSAFEFPDIEGYDIIEQIDKDCK